jgi:hypothetical protein
MSTYEAAILVWDTSAVDAVVRGIVHKISTTGVPGSAPNREAEFLAAFEVVFEGVANRLQCVNHTSDRVFIDEINPELPGCPLRNGKPLVEAYCGKQGFTELWSTSIEQRIPCEDVTDDESDGVRHLMVEDRGRKDASLVVAALKLGNASGQQVVIVTDDIGFAEEIINLPKRHAVIEIGGSQYSTTCVTTSLSIQVLRELHLSCGIDNETWHHIILAFKHHHNGRIGQAARQHDRQVIEFFERFQADCAEKARRAITQELEQAFGEVDG